MFLLRDAQMTDLGGLLQLANVLDTVNLPADEKTLAETIEHSVRSFTGEIKNPFKRTYLFVLEDPRSEEVIGTSLVIAQHGTRHAPHVFMDVDEREHYSQMLDRHFRHKVLRIGYNYAGHTEIGGLVVQPQFRGMHKPGKQLSFVRFLYIAMHREDFRERVLAELMPPLLPGGRSTMWEAFGAKVTGLTYPQADKLSRESKEFIKELFPQGEIYVELLPQDVQDVIETVGPETKPVLKMLSDIGFEYDKRIDPFDGGPHYSAQTADIKPVADYRRARVMEECLQRDWAERLVAVERAEGNSRFRVVRTPCRLDDDKAYLPEKAKALLGVSTGDQIHTVPFDS